MVSLITLMAGLLPSNALVAGSGYPKDTTANWCASKFANADERVYRCYPNPWGSGNVHLYIRFTDTAGIKGCLTGEPTLALLLLKPFQPGDWLFSGGGGPYVPRLTFDQDRACLNKYKITNTATPGDSIEMEFWFTPQDTIVADTVRGTFKAWYRGRLVVVGVQPQTPTQPIHWTRNGLYSSLPLEGPFGLTDLRGRSHPIQIRPSGTGTLVAPSRRLPTGVYRLTWPSGQAAVLIPGD
jgi:hypothetical protein